MSAEPVVYLDSSALVKLIVRERESRALRQFLRSAPTRVSCALACIEVVRAVQLQGRPTVTRARRLLERMSLLALDDALLDAAGAIPVPGLRSLDAIHLAAAQTFGDLSALVTYDARLTVAGELLGLPVAAPR
jgi:uncharacterized protein